MSCDTCLVRGGHRNGARVRYYNLGTLPPAYNALLSECGAVEGPQLRCLARGRAQRLAGCAAGAAAGGGFGFGNGEAAAGAVAVDALGGFGFLGRIFRLRALGGGATGLSSANTGLGSIVVEAGVVKSPGFRITWTGTVTGRNLGIAKVTVKPVSGAATATVQGVLQAGPTDVVASAPEGTEFELDLNRRWRRLEGVEGERGTAGQTGPGDGNRDNTTHDQPPSCGKNATIPIWDHRSAGTELQPGRVNSLRNG